jgi:hypothetical protein
VEHFDELDHFDELEKYIKKNSDDSYDPEEPGNSTPPSRTKRVKQEEQDA